MGAAVAVLATSDYAQIFLTYRATAFGNEAARKLLDLMVAELEDRGESRAEVHLRAVGQH
jgi:hypothetical protein